MLAPYKGSYDKPSQHIKKRDITLPTKVHSFSSMYGCESWIIKKTEHRRIDAFKLWCWRRLLRVPWTARRWNQSILKETNPEYSFKGLMQKLKLQYFGYLVWRADLLEKTDAGKDWGQEEKKGDRGWYCWMASPLQWTWVWASSRREWSTGKPGVLQFMGSQRVGRDWTELNWCVDVRVGP